MTGAKIAIAAIIALAIGVACGMYTVQARFNPQLEQLSAERDQALAKASELRKSNAEAIDLEREIARLREEVERLRARPEPAADATLAPTEETGDPAFNLEEATDALSAALQSEDRDRGRGWGDREPPKEGTPEYAEWQARREQWQQEREERSREFRSRMDGFFNDAMQKTNDPAAQQRIAAISEYTNYTMDLFREMRDAESDEERDQIRQDLSITFEETRSLVRDQQDYLIGEALKENGVSNPQEQQALVNAVRETMEDPFFRMPGGGGGPPMWGWGDRGRGPGGDDQSGDRD
ncbi:MAG: hypothetical protein AMXMBFR82_19630 [Candidatus Hydrogenedentota bacterium]